MTVFDKFGVKYCVRNQIPSSFDICCFSAEKKIEHYQIVLNNKSEYDHPETTFTFSRTMGGQPCFMYSGLYSQFMEINCSSACL